MKKSTLAHLWEIEGETLDKTSRNQIRDYGVDVNQYICQHWQIESNQFYPMSKNFGESIDLNQVDRLVSIFKDKRKNCFVSMMTLTLKKSISFVLGNLERTLS